MNNSIILLIISLFVISCAAPDKDGITISGVVENPPGEGNIQLEKYGQTDVEKLTDIPLEGNTFSYQLDSVKPGFYRVNFFDNQFVNLVLNDSDIKLTVDGSSPTGKVLIEGSPEMDFLEKVKGIYSDYQSEINELNSRYAQANMNQDQETMDNLYGQLIGLQRKYSNLIKEEIDAIGPSIATLQAVSYLDPDQDFPFMDSLATELASQYPDNIDVKSFVQQVNELKAISIGSEAPDFTLQSPNGEEISLSSFKGEYVLLDFWAAWCKPCRMENPNLVEMYKAYNNQGFEIFGVSLDQSDGPWQEAIKKDELSWKQVRDKQNDVSQKYRINAIPMNFLLNEEGVIIDKNLRGEALRQKLAKIFS